MTALAARADIPIYEELTELTSEERMWLFMHLWDPENPPTTRRTPTGDLMCLACGQLEVKSFSIFGDELPIDLRCNNRDCIRSRITNKLHLSRW